MAPPVVAAAQEVTPANTPPELLAGTEQDVIPAQVKPGADGRITRVRLVRVAGKYPLRRREEVLVRTAQGVTIAEAREMVADHLLVTVAPGKEPALAAALTGAGCTARRILPGGRTALATFAYTEHDQYAQQQAKLAAQPGVRVAEPDYIVHTNGTPGDPGFSLLWGMHNVGQSGGTSDADIDAVEAWDITTGSKNVLVGIIDTGIDAAHPDLMPNLWANPGETGLDTNGINKATNGIDDDGNGYIDDARGWDFVSEDNNPQDDNNHGTHCAGTIGGAGNNGQGVAGVCWNVSLVGLKFLSASGSGAISDAIEATLYATAIGCTLTSNSWGGGGYSQTLKDAIDAADAAGVLYVAAAGNSTQNNDSVPSYPSSYASANIIAVAATDRNDGIATFSSYGATSVDLGAPGVEVYSTTIGNTYQYFNGTSMATPHVAGACALLKSANPSLTSAQIKQVLLANVDPIPSLTGKTLTGGRLNVFKAVLAVSGPALAVQSSTQTEQGNGNGTINPGEGVALAMTVASVGAEPLVAVVGQLVLSHPALTLVDDTVIYGDLAPGAIASGDGSYLVQVAVDAPTPLVANGTVTFTAASGGPWTKAVTVSVYTVSTLSGVVRTKASAPLAGATVSWIGTSTGSTTTAADGTYQVSLINGAYSVRASAPGYLTSPYQAATLPPGAIRDFMLGRPDIALSPTQVAMTAKEGQTASATLTVVNEGDEQLVGTIATGATWTATGLWHETAYRTADGGTSWYYGLDATHSYDTGSANSGAITAVVTVPIGTPTLTFQQWRQTETGTSYDQSLVQVAPIGGTAWTTVFQSTWNTAAWNTASVNLAAYAGQQVQLRFFFNTVDAAANNYEGWYVDNIRLGGTPMTGWLTVAPATFSLSGTASTVITLTASASALSGGIYTSVLAVSSNDPDEAALTVPVTFTVVGSPNLSLQSITLADGDAPANGDGDQRAEPGETIALGVSVRNGGSASAIGVTGTLSSSDPYLTITTPSATHGTIAQGQNSLGSPVVAQIAAACPNNYDAVCSYTVSDDAGTVWVLPVTVRVEWRSRVSGTVSFAATGSPVPSATVMIGTTSVTTGADGTYAVPNLPAGTYAVSAAKSGYLTATSTVTLPSDAVWSPTLSTRQLGVAPSTFVVRIQPNQTASRTLSLTNQGDLPVTWSIPAPTAATFTPTGLWHETAYRSADGGTSWYYGLDATHTYNTGATNSGALTTTVTVPTGAASLTFQQWRLTEGGTSYDQSLVQVAAIGGSTWTTVYQSTWNSAAWNTASVNFSAYAGQQVQVRFFFNTVDSGANSYEGWYVDDLRLNGVPLGTAQPWLSVSPTSGTVTAATTQTVALNFSSAQLAFGTYNQLLQVNSDDTDSPSVQVATTLEVASATPPIAYGLGLLTPEDTALPITLDGSDADGDSLVYSIVTPPAGTLSGSGTSRTYVPQANFSGVDSFTFRVFDGFYYSAIATVTITVTPVNDPPIITPATLLVPVGGTNSVTLVATDSDSASLTWSLLGQPAHGTASLSGAQLTVTAAAGYTGTDSVSVSVSDGTASVIGTVPVSIYQPEFIWSTQGNSPAHRGVHPGAIENQAPPTLVWSKSYDQQLNPPVVANGLVYVTPDTYFGNTYASAVVVANGSEFWRRTFTSAYSINHPTVVGNALYLQRGNSSSDSQLFKLNASTGATIWSAPFQAQWEDYLAPCVADGKVFVNAGSYGGLNAYSDATGAPLFTAPRAQYDMWTPAYANGRLFSWADTSLAEHDAATGAILWQVTLPKSWGGYDMNTAVCVATDALVAIEYNTGAITAVDLTTHAIRFTRTAGYRGTPSVHGSSLFAYTANGVDEIDLTSGTLVRTYSLGGALVTGGTQPIILDDAVIASTPSVIAGFKRGITTPVWTLPYGGPIALAGTHLLVANGTTLRSFRLPNRAPLITVTSPITTAEDTAVTGTYVTADADRDTVTVTLGQAPTKGQVELLAGSWSYTPALNANGSDTYVLTASDGILTTSVSITVTVTPVNDAPTAQPAAATIAAGETTSIGLNGADLDGDALTSWRIVDPSPSLTATISGSLVTVRGIGGFVGTTAFTVACSDGQLESAPAIITVTVGALPSGYQSLALGATGANGSAAWNADTVTWTLAGAGAGIAGTADAAQFAYRELAGDFDYVARIPFLPLTTAKAQAGLMLRESMAVGSRDVFVGLLGTKKVAWVRRTTVDATAAQSTWNVTTPPWVKLTRRGNVVTAYRSTDGATWTSCGSSTMGLPASVFVGPTVASGVTGTLMTATLTNVALSEPSLSSPGELAINFQPGTAPVVLGGITWLIADGAPFAPRWSGQSFGFSTATTTAYNRNSALSLDERYDTLVNAPVTSTFGVAVPNGRYSVTLCAGDASATSGKIRADIQGTRAITGDTTSANRWFTATSEVIVTDGRMTFSCGAGATVSRWAWVTIIPLLAAPAGNS